MYGHTSSNPSLNVNHQHDHQKSIEILKNQKNIIEKRKKFVKNVNNNSIALAGIFGVDPNNIKNKSQNNNNNASQKVLSNKGSIKIVLTNSDAIILNQNTFQRKKKFANNVNASTEITASIRHVLM